MLPSSPAAMKPIQMFRLFQYRHVSQPHRYSFDDIPDGHNRPFIRGVPSRVKQNFHVWAKADSVRHPLHHRFRLLFRVVERLSLRKYLPLVALWQPRDHERDFSLHILLLFLFFLFRAFILLRRQVRRSQQRIHGGSRHPRQRCRGNDGKRSVRQAHVVGDFEPRSSLSSVFALVLVVDSFVFFVRRRGGGCTFRHRAFFALGGRLRRRRRRCSSSSSSS